MEEPDIWISDFQFSGVDKELAKKVIKTDATLIFRYCDVIFGWPRIGGAGLLVVSLANSGRVAWGWFFYITGLR